MNRDRVSGYEANSRTYGGWIDFIDYSHLGNYSGGILLMEELAIEKSMERFYQLRKEMDEYSLST